MILWNEEDPLVLMPGEQTKSNELLNRYYQLGHKRSLAALSRESDVNLSERQLQRYSSDHDWVARVARQTEIDNAKIRDSLLDTRIEVLEKFSEVLIDSLNNADTEGSSLSQLSGGVKTFIETVQSVFDMMPRQRIETVDLNNLSFDEILKQVEFEEK